MITVKIFDDEKNNKLNEDGNLPFTPVEYTVPENWEETDYQEFCKLEKFPKKNCIMMTIYPEARVACIHIPQEGAGVKVKFFKLPPFIE